MNQLPPTPPPPPPAAVEVPFNTVGADRGIEWVKAGLAEVTADIGTWAAIAGIYGVACLIIGLIPFLGGLAIALSVPIVVGGLMIGCRTRAEGGKMQVEHLWIAFKGPWQQLAIVGAILLGISFVVGLIVGGIVAAMLFGSFSRGGPGIGVFFIAGLIQLVVTVPILTFVSFSPPLVAIRGLNAIDSLKNSFKAALANLVPLLIMIACIAVPVFIINAILSSTFTLILLTPLVGGAALMVGCASLYAAFREVYGG
jgi:hypothetical protein